MGVLHMLPPRQIIDDDPNDGQSWWYYSTTALIIKWVIAAVIIIALLTLVVGGHFHAQHRMKKGLPPLRYHAWLINRQQRARWFPQQTYYHTGGWHGPAMPMQPQGPAPPAYEHEYVPPYAPPQGASKANPDQTYEVVRPGFEGNAQSSSMPAPYLPGGRL